MDQRQTQGNDSRNRGLWRERQTLAPGRLAHKAAKAAKPIVNRRVQTWRERLPNPAVLARAIRTAARARRGVLRGMAIGLVAVVGMGSAYYWASTSPRFAVTSIHVDGNHQVSLAQINAALPFPMGANIFGVDTSRAEAALLAMPWVRAARVVRAWPNTIAITIAERQAAAIVALNDLYLVDAKGAFIKKCDIAAGEGGELPILLGLSREAFAGSDGASPGQARVVEMLALLRTWASNAARPAIAEVVFDGGAYTLRTAETEIEIHLDGTALASRLAVFDAAWQSLAADEKARLRALRLDSTRDHVTVAFATE